MRIHLNLTAPEVDHLLDAARRAAGVQFERKSHHGSQSHTMAVDVILSGDAPHRINSRDTYAENAASWDQWGIFLAVIYAADPTAKSWAYDDAQDFHEQTGNRFNASAPDAIRVDSMSSPQYQRTSHKWKLDREAFNDHPSSIVYSCVNKRHGECTAVMTR